MNAMSMQNLVRHDRRRALTLVELLVVIAVIAILISLLYVGSAMAMETVRRIKCASNLRQIGVAVASQAAQNNFQLPRYYDLTLQSANKWKLFAKFQHTPSDICSFVNPALLLCPSDKNPSPFDFDNPPPSVVPSSYGYNFIPYIAGIGTMDLDAGKTFLFFDGKCDTSAQAGHWKGDASDAARFSSDLGVSRHRKKMNVLFVDGHCEQLGTLPASGVLPPQ